MLSSEEGAGRAEHAQFGQVTPSQQAGTLPSQSLTIHSPNTLQAFKTH